MSLSVTYDSTLSRIKLAASSLGASATYAVFDRTINGVTYTTLRGGASVVVSSQAAALNDYEFEPGVEITYRVRSYNSSDVLQETFTESITQDLDDVWFKVPAAPFLNTPVRVREVGDIARRSRAGVFDVVGRSNPVMVGDVASSVEFTLGLLTRTKGEESDLDYLFASGEVVFVQLPSTTAWFPGGYYSVGDTSRVPVSKVSPTRLWSVPLKGVAAPGPEVVSSAYTWQSVVNEYTDWADEIADNASWSALLERTGTPGDVIVP